MNRTKKFHQNELKKHGIQLGSPLSSMIISLMHYEKFLNQWLPKQMDPRLINQCSTSWNNK